jgi:hypothetical protein
MFSFLCHERIDLTLVFRLADAKEDGGAFNSNVTED